MTSASDIIADLRRQRAEAEPTPPAVPVPGEGPVDIVSWNGNVYAARSGCIWMATDEGWTLADGADLPPSFPPRKERAEHE